MKTVLLVLSVLAITASSASAQANTRVLGVGRIAFDIVGLSPIEANAQQYKAYMPSTLTVGVNITATCVVPDAGAVTNATATCTFPLTALPLTTAFQSLALTASVTAPDGTVEGAKVVAPFALALVGQPVSPQLAMRIRPATP